jgi:hypothetical protein
MKMKNSFFSLVNLGAIINFDGLCGIIRWYAGHLSGWWRCFSQWGGGLTCSVFVHLGVLSSLSKRPASCTCRSVVNDETRITNL